MGFTALHILLWLLPAFTLTTQELVTLDVSPKITAVCGKQVTLNCNVSSPTDGLSVTHMGWYQNKSILCSVDSKGNIHKPHINTSRDFDCEYKHGHLALIFQKVKPLKSGHSNRYMCKLRSNKGALHEYTALEIQECSLKSPKSGINFASNLNPQSLGTTDLDRNGGGSQGHMRTVLCISIALAVTLK